MIYQHLLCFFLLIGVSLYSHPEEKQFAIVIPSYNNKDWYIRNLDSVVSQSYGNYKIIYIDDASIDGTGELVKEYIKERHLENLVTFIQNEQRVGALANIYRAVWMCDPSAVVAIVDGDDWLAHGHVLEKLNEVYSDENVWMTYGQFIEYPTNYIGGAENIPTDVIQRNAFRDFRWVATHLRTFYARLFHKIHKEDLLYEGKFFPVTGDLAVTFPLLEMSGSHSKFISSVLYAYNVATPLSDNKLQKALQIHLENVIRSKNRYTPIEPNQFRPFVTCDLRGGLGNLLFGVAATLAYAWDNDATCLLPDLNRGDSNISYNRDRLFFRLSAANLPRPVINSYKEPIWHSSQKIPFQPDLKIFGYFQSWKLFDHHRDKLLSRFAPSQSVLNRLQEKYGDLIANPNTVGVHVRTFNSQLHHSKLHPFLGLEYYKNAIDFFPPDTLFVVFSDRINWCKYHFSQLDKQFIFIEGNDAVEDLFLMSMMKHNIICNSSFSWWSAYLNQNPEKKVIAPKWWMHPDVYDFPSQQPNDLLLPDWIMIPWNLQAPYPIDMCWYDTTKSLDGN